MQNSMYTTSGLTSLPNYVGGGYVDQDGRQQYGLGKLVKKVFKPVAKVLDKIVPNEIKPALPFLAAAAPFLAPGLIGGIGGLFTTNPALAGAIGSGVLNVGAQAAQEGAAQRGLNLGSLALSSLGGALSNPGAADYFGGSQVVGNAPMTALNPELAQYGNLATQSIPVTAADVISGAGIPTSTDLSMLDKIQNVATSSAQKAAEFIDKGRAGLESEGIFNTDFLKAAAPGQIGAVADKAYAAAQDAQIAYEKQLAQVGQTVAKNKSDQINFIRQAMVSSGFTDDEISSALTRSGFADGGSSNKSQPMPINPELLAIAIFGKRLDELTSTQKNALSDYIDVPKKAKGGIMDLGGNEMDFRAAGGFVPIGKKERADDVPARLSKNEFVFTAKAVRNAGNGDIKKGAKKMYQIMRQLEAKA